VVAWWLFDVPELYGNADVDGYILLVATPFLWTLAAGAYGLRAPVAGSRRAVVLDDLAGVAGLMTLGAWAVILSSYATGKPDPDIPQLSAFWALGIVAVTVARQAVRATTPSAAPAPRLPQRLHWRPARPPRELVLADAIAIFVVAMVSWPVFQEPKPADSTLWAWVLLLVGIPVWVGIGAASGLYAEPRSLRSDLVAALHLASAGAWLIMILTPIGGEIDPDIPQVFGVWACTIAAVAATRRVALSGRRRAEPAAGSGGRAARAHRERPSARRAPSRRP
jgi:hypothetical protein